MTMLFHVSSSSTPRRARRSLRRRTQTAVLGPSRCTSSNHTIRIPIITLHLIPFSASTIIPIHTHPKNHHITPTRIPGLFLLPLPHLAASAQQQRSRTRQAPLLRGPNRPARQWRQQRRWAEAPCGFRPSSRSKSNTSPPRLHRPQAQAGDGTMPFSNVLCRAVAVLLRDDSISEVGSGFPSVPPALPPRLRSSFLLCSQPRSGQISSPAHADSVLFFVLGGFVSRSSAFTYGGKTVRLLMAWVREGFRAKPRLQTTPSAAYRQVRLT